MTSTTRTDVGLLALRAGVGATLAAHGAQKLLGWFGGHGVAGTTGAMAAMGFEPARPSALAAGAGELGGGVLLALGLATPVGGAAAASTMLAAGAVHAPAGFFAQQGGWEHPGVLGLAGAALAVTGPGRLSLDHALGHRLDTTWQVVGALTALVSTSAAVVARRQRAVAAAAAAAPEDQPDAAGAGESAGAAPTPSRA